VKYLQQQPYVRLLGTIVRNTFGSSFAKFMTSSWTIEGYLQQRSWEKVHFGDTFSDISDTLWRYLQRYFLEIHMTMIYLVPFEIWQ